MELPHLSSGGEEHTLCLGGLDTQVEQTLPLLQDEYKRQTMAATGLKLSMLVERPRCRVGTPLRLRTYIPRPRY